MDALLPEAFAVCREGAWRSLGMKHFYVQVIGGIVLHQGRISEMKTGEGKTLVATLPAYLNALEGKGVQDVYKRQVQEYLIRRLYSSDTRSMRSFSSCVRSATCSSDNVFMFS